MKDANAATDDTTQGRMTRKNSGFERDSNPQPLRYRCNALGSALYVQWT